jgi:hypothetical protein
MSRSYREEPIDRSKIHKDEQSTKRLKDRRDKSSAGMSMRPDPEFFVSDIPIDPAPFFDSIDSAENGMRALAIVLASQELGIFNFCRKPRLIRELARSTGTDEVSLAYLCDALVSLRLLKKDGETIRNARATSLFLTDDSPYSQVHYIRELGRHFKDL